MVEKIYRPRIADDILRRKLEAMGAVLIEGAKACGKTTTAVRQAASVLNMDDPRHAAQYLQMADTDPALLLEGETPRLIDEWQTAPKIWDAVRFTVDQRDEDGLFILTGSAVAADRSDIRHSGTGRFAWMTMRPMTLWESGESNGKVSLKDLFLGKAVVGSQNAMTLRSLANITCRGGWPRAVTRSGERALAQAQEYYEAIARQDISRTDGINRNENTARRLLRSYARHQGTQASIETIKADITASGDNAISNTTIETYLAALRRIFVIEDMPAWNPNLRSKTAVRTSDTRYFTDPSVAAAALGIGPDDLVGDLATFGLMFETLAVRDLRVYADALGGNVYHYRDKTGLECDAVVHLRNGQYGLVEIKLGGDRLIAEGVKTLTALAAKIDTDRMREPAFLMVLAGVAPYAYRRTDGVLVVPLSTLKN